MKKIYSIFSLLTLLILASCQQEDNTGGTGYLRLEVGTNAFVNPQTKVTADYNPKQIAVQILDATNAIVEETDDWETWSGKQLRLKPGGYTIKASSNGFDGSESGFDIPYYVGSEKITVESGKEKTANITCTLANVKVTVNFDQSFINAFQSATTTVASQLANVNKLSFKMGVSNKSAYYPVGNLSAIVSVINKKGKQYFQTNQITNVKARDHYILNYKIAESGSMGNVNVTVDDTQTIYTFTFNVSTEASTQLAVKAANTWSTFAYLEGEIVSAKEELNPANMSFEYKRATEETWNSVPAINEDNKFKTTLKNLIPGISYSYRLVYSGTEKYASDPIDFTTETQSKILNLNFDDWYKNGKHYYACTDLNNKLWDSGNEGANTLKEINPTKPEDSDVINGKAAKLWSAIAAGQFAAGSLFTGDFGNATITPVGAKLNFGQPFKERPSQLTGWFKYSAGTITHTKKDFIKKGDRDSCSVYIALTDWSAPFAVSTGDNKFVDLNDNSIIAYGELDKDLLSPATPMSEYQKFTIDIKYRSLTRKPTYILIVCSSSKYGDYFTGSTSSVLLLDEFDFLYGEPTVDPNYIK